MNCWFVELSRHTSLTKQTKRIDAMKSSFDVTLGTSAKQKEFDFELLDLRIYVFIGPDR